MSLTGSPGKAGRLGARLAGPSGSRLAGQGPGWQDPLAAGWQARARLAGLAA